MSLISYIIKRLITSVFLFIGGVTLTWFFITYIPGSLYNPVLEGYGFDQPFFVQLGEFFAGLFTGNWGPSFYYPGLDSSELIRAWLPRTIEIAIIPLIVVNILAARSGKYSAAKKGKPMDNIIRIAAVIMVSLPIFWVAILFQYFFRAIVPVITFGIIDLPVAGLFSREFFTVDVPFVTGFRTIDSLLNNQLDVFLDTLLHLIVPIMVFFVITFGNMFRSARACMLDTIESDYIRTARAKGVTEKDVINKHAFRNAIIPWSTFLGFNIAYYLMGAVFIEMIFHFNGIGKGLIIAIQQTDYFVIRACVVAMIIVYIVVNLVVDVAYAILDPRIIYD